MSLKNTKLCEDIWHSFEKGEIGLKEISHRLQMDGGHDMISIEISEISQLITWKFLGDWNKVGFAFSELLAFYSAYDLDKDSSRIICWICCVLILADAIKHEGTEWEFNLHAFVLGLCKIKNLLTISQMVMLFDCLFETSSASGSKIPSE